MMTRLLSPSSERPYCTVSADGPATILDVPPNTVEQLYRQHGAVLLRGFAVDVQLLGNFAERMCVAPMPSRGPLRETLDPARNIQTVAAGGEAFPLHPELSREPWRPDIAMFACLNPPRAGGETLICDGVTLAAALPEPVRRAFEGRRLRYIYGASAEVLSYWLGTAEPSAALLASPGPACPFRFARVDGGYVREFSRPALHRPMFSDQLAFGNFLLFARYASGRSDVPLFDDGSVIPEALALLVRDTGERVSVPIQWQANDLLLLDNTRFMHGRNAILDVDERQIISYFGYLRFALADPEEPVDPPWRRPGFQPPVPPVPVRA